MALAAAGDADRTVTLLERIEPQGLALWWMMQFPAFDRVRRDARFARLEAELAPPGR